MKTTRYVGLENFNGFIEPRGRYDREDLEVTVMLRAGAITPGSGDGSSETAVARMLALPSCRQWSTSSMSASPFSLLRHVTFRAVPLHQGALAALGEVVARNS